MIIYPAIIITLLFIIFFIVLRRVILLDNPDAEPSIRIPKFHIPTSGIYRGVDRLRKIRELTSDRIHATKKEDPLENVPEQFEDFWKQSSEEDAESQISSLRPRPNKKLPTASIDPLERAEDLFKKKQFISAEKWYIEAAKNNPKNPKIYSRLAVIYLEANNLKDAQEALEESIKLDKTVASRYFNLSYIYFNQSKFKESADCARRAFNLEPENAKYKAWVEQLRKERF